MDDDRSIGDTAGAIGGGQAARTLAREAFRRWMRNLDGDELNRVGSAAVLQSADAVGQFADMPRGSSAETVLMEVEKLAAKLMTPTSPPPRRWWFRKADGTGDLPSHAITGLIHQLDRRRDDGARRIIALNTVRTRLDAAERALEDALSLMDALGHTIEAGFRELRVEDPAAAATVQERGSTMLMERRQAVLTQLSVHRQSTMTLDLLMANQQELNAALERTRTATLSALQVAVAAKRATADAVALHADATSAQVQRALYEALQNARAVIEETGSRQDRSVLDRRP